MARLSIRVDLGSGGRIGPGKIRVLEEIARHGSISAAGRVLGMSYRRTWDLVADLNAAFREPVVQSQPGGKQGGGATLTAFGLALVERYRAIEQAAHAATEEARAALESAAASG